MPLAPHRPTRVVLAVLFAGSFVMGSAEMLVVGMIDLIAADLTVSVAAAGALVTANALGLAVGGPILTFLTTRFDRRPVLLSALAVFIAANLLPVLGAGHSPFLAARVVIGAVQGLFIAAAITTATSIVPPERAGRAMAVVISGFATASALGLPLGTLLGQAVGWRGSFAAVVGISLLVLAAAAAVLPSVRTATQSRAGSQVRHAFAPRVLAVLAVICLMFGGIQSAMTYLVPYLTQVTGVPAPAVSAFLLGYGVACAVASAGGGRFADLDAAGTIVVGTIGVTVSLVALFLFGTNAALVALAVVGLGAFGMGIAPAVQHRVVTLAGPGGPLAASLPSSAANAGIAIGAAAGGIAIGTAGIPAVAVTGAVIAALAAGAALATHKLRPPAPAGDGLETGHERPTPPLTDSQPCAVNQ